QVGALHNTVAIRMIPYLSPAELAVLWSKLEGSRCWADFDPAKKNLIYLYKSVSDRNAHAMVADARAILSDAASWNPAILEYALAAAMLGEIADGQNSQALELWDEYSGLFHYEGTMPLYMRLLVAHSQQSPT